jgi:hypothetical protein
MLGLVALSLALRPFGTFMEGMINCVVWATGILASVSYHLFSEGKLKGVGNKACTYTVVALTFVVMFAIVVHVMLGVFSKERQDARTKRTRVLTPSVAGEILSDAIRMIPSQEFLVIPNQVTVMDKNPEEAPAPEDDNIAYLKSIFFSYFAAGKEPETGEVPVELQPMTVGGEDGQAKSPRS